MAVKSREEIVAQLSARIGADTSDDAIALIEDVTDTLSDLETKATGDGKDWKSEAERIDREWREKYIARFSGNGDDDEQDNLPKPRERKPLSFDELFKEKE